MRLGVLDIGSNSAQLQIVDVAAGAPPLPALAVKTPTLLGEEITADGSISPEGGKRVVEAVVRSMSVAVQQQVDQLYPLRHVGRPRCHQPRRDHQPGGGGLRSASPVLVRRTGGTAH